MGIQSTLRSIASALIRNPLPGALVAGIIAKAIQVAVSSFFRASPHFISLIARASSIPGGSALVSYGPSVLIALATGALLRYRRTSVKPYISTAMLTALLQHLNTPVKPIFSTPVLKRIFDYKSLHFEVDSLLQEDAAKEGRSQIFTYPGFFGTAYTCSNYPKQEEGYKIFCDAFGYAENNTIQIAAIADGCGWGKKSQRSARAMVDNFMSALHANRTNGLAEQLVMTAAQDSQREIEKNHNPSSHDSQYGSTTFLGGLIFEATDGKRYFTGVNCGDCKLYLLSQGKFTELTKPARISATDTGGRFGTNRRDRDKTEYAFSIKVQSGDKLFFMTDGVHDNLDIDPPEKETPESLGAADLRKLSTLQKFHQDEQLGQNIMNFAYDYSAKHLNEVAKGTDMNYVSIKEFPGKPDHMTLLVVHVR